MKRTTRFLVPIAAILAAMAITAAPAGATAGYGWLDSNGGDPATAQTANTAPPQTVVVSDGGGFSWGDAFIGAGVAVAIMLIAGVSLYELRRHGRVTVAHPRA